MEVMAKGDLKLRIPELLEEKGWNKTRFAKEANISYPTALRLANNEVHSISLDMLDKLCSVFGVSVDEMMAREE